MNDWRNNAACRGMNPAIFFPELGNHNHAAKQICAGCPVSQQCADAGAGEDFGVWGGLNPMERHTGTSRTSTYVRLETVLALLRAERWLTPAQIGERLGVSRDAARRSLYRLKDQELVDNDHGFWCATEHVSRETVGHPSDAQSACAEVASNTSSTGAP